MPEPTPPPVVEVPAMEPAAAPPPVPIASTPIFSQDAIKEMSKELTEVVTGVIMNETPESVSPQPAPTSERETVTAASSQRAQQKPSAKNHMLTVVRARKAERLEKIVVLAVEREVITNNDVQILLGVSDATATNYLHELVSAGRLKRTGVRAGTSYHPL